MPTLQLWLRPVSFLRETNFTRPASHFTTSFVKILTSNSNSHDFLISARSFCGTFIWFFLPSTTRPQIILLSIQLMSECIKRHQSGIFHIRTCSHRKLWIIIFCLYLSRNRSSSFSNGVSYRHRRFLHDSHLFLGLIQVSCRLRRETSLAYRCFMIRSHAALVVSIRPTVR